MGKRKAKNDSDGQNSGPPNPQPRPMGKEAVIAAAAAEGRPVRVYADGIFDMFHFGHARALEQAKKCLPNVYLLVGCCSDEITHRYKGKTVMTDKERYESLRHCKWVDEVIPDAPWVITPEFLDKHNIDFVAHDDLPYADASGQSDDCYGPVKRMGKFIATQRTEGVSTSDLILRILKDYNEYVLRNLARGYSRHDLGISLVKEQRIRASHNIKKLRERLQEERLRVADRITKRMGIKRPAGAGAGNRRASNSAPAAADSGSGDSDGSGSPGSPNAQQLRRKEIADVIRRNGEDLAETVEQVVEKIMRGDYGKEVSIASKQMTEHMDKFVTGFFRSFELGYTKLEQAIRSTVDWSHKAPGQLAASSSATRLAAAGGAGSSSAAARQQRQQQRLRWAPLEFMSRPEESDADMEEDEEAQELSGSHQAVTV